MAAITIIDQLKNLPVNTIVHDIIDFVLNPAFSLTGETLLITKTIREIMFGYEDVFLKTVKVNHNLIHIKIYFAVIIS
jgi:hypothetical protein